MHFIRALPGFVLVSLQWNNLCFSMLTFHHNVSVIVVFWLLSLFDCILTIGTVFCHEATVGNCGIRVEVEWHWAKGRKGSWNTSTTQSCNSRATSCQAVYLQPIICTAGVCWTTENNSNNRFTYIQYITW